MNRRTTSLGFRVVMWANGLLATLTALFGQWLVSLLTYSAYGPDVSFQTFGAMLRVCILIGLPIATIGGVVLERKTDSPAEENPTFFRLWLGNGIGILVLMAIACTQAKRF